MTTTKTALVTGGSSGLGLALVKALSARGWRVVTDGRRSALLRDRFSGTGAIAIAGDIADAEHRAALVVAVDGSAAGSGEGSGGGLDLLVHNASTLGPLPLHRLADLPPESIAAIFETNAVAPVALTTALLPALRRTQGIVVSLSSDAAVEHYETWGGYGASKAALDHLVLTIGVENGLRTYAVDPGNMRTPMHQDAFPGEDISDRPLPESVVPHLLALVDAPPEPGRYRARDFAPVGVVA